MNITRLTDQTIEVRNYYDLNDRFTFFLCSDVHFDNPKCNRQLFFKHLDEVKKRNAMWLCFGDFFDLMGGKYDPRRAKSDIRAEYNKNNYLDLVIDDAYEQLLPYAENLLLFSDGNHETSITRSLETNPLARLVKAMQHHAPQLQHGFYQGFLRFKFEYNLDKGGGSVKKRILFWHHGKFGGVVSKGTQGVARYGLIAPVADIVVSGHTHDEWIVSQPRYCLKDNGEVKVEKQYHVKTATYKEEFEVSSGWAVENIVMPKNVGGFWWVHFDVTPKGVEIKLEMA